MSTHAGQHVSSQITPEEASTLAQEAYLFGLPLVYIDANLDILTNVARPQGGRAPINQLARFREFPDASNKTVVGFNVDTLYTLAQMDLSIEPMVLSVPPMGERYWIAQLIDAWNDVPHAPGSRTVGGEGGNFAIVGPQWQGTIPADLTELRMPTSLAILAGRIYTAGSEDYAAVHALQDQWQLVPLSAWGSDYVPPDSVPLKPGVDSKTPLAAQIRDMSAETFFNRLTTLLVNNPPSADDAPIMARIARLGIKPGAPFSMSAFEPDVRQAIEQGAAAGLQAIRDEEPKLGEHVNGWGLSRDLGRYGTRYLYRAAWTFFGVGGNLVEDAFYPLSLVDGDGKPYDGTNKYELRFTREQLPPVDAFWSVTMYDKDSYLVDNPINRYALGDRSNMTFADDGSLAIYIQSDAPGDDKAANWLPAPTVWWIQARAAALRAQTGSDRRHMGATTSNTRRIAVLQTSTALRLCRRLLDDC